MSIESQIDAGEYSSVPKMTFAELVDRYVEEVTVNKGAARSEALRLAKTLLGTVELEDLSKQEFEQWQNQRLVEVSVLSVLRERVSLSAVIRMS